MFFKAYEDYSDCVVFNGMNKRKTKKCEMNDFALSAREWNILALKAGGRNRAMCDYRCSYVLACAHARVPPSEAAGAPALVIFPVAELEVRPLFVSAAVGQVLPQQLVRVDLSVSASSWRQR